MREGFIEGVRSTDAPSGGRPAGRVVRSSADGGQVLPLVAILVVAVAVVGVVVVGQLGRLVDDRARARTAADAGALAGATSGARAARAAVGRNGGELIEMRHEGATVVVRARVGGAEASSAARPRRCPAGSATGSPVSGCRDRSP